MRRVLFIGYFAFLAPAAAGQTCVHTGLSRSLIFKTEITRIKRNDAVRDSCVVRITISRKQAQAANHTVVFSTVELYDSDYTRCSWVRSYSTGKTPGSDNTVLDEDYGDLVVGDFNFDGRDDFAAKRESPNGGTQYNYYVQRKSGAFELDNFLTEKVGYAPDKLNAATLTLQTFAHAGAGWGATTFKFNPATATWRETRHLFLRAVPPGHHNH